MHESTSPPPEDAATENAQARIESGLQVVREDIARQLRRIGHAAQELDARVLPRFASDLPDELPPARIAELERQVRALEPWLQGPFVLAGNFVIPGLWRNDRRWEWLGEQIGDLSGRRVLDVGSNAGYDPFMFRLKGAQEVMACEPFEFIHQARFLEQVYRSGVDFRQIGWQQLDPQVHGRFELVHCHGVLYHEPHPILMLQKLRSMVADDGELLLGSMLHASADQSEYIRFVPDAYAGDRTWWFVPGRLAMRWMLEVVGFEVEELSLSEGPRGEFPTLNGYFRARPVAPTPELATPAALDAGAPMRFPVGHYYSPMFDARELAEQRDRIWPATPRPTPDVEWRESAQLELCQQIFGEQEPLALSPDQSEDPTEYWAGNDQYPPLDAWVLAALLRHLRPARMVEIGSGFSSLVTARVNREELGGELRFTCVEPHPRQFLLDGVDGISELRAERVQDSPLELFTELGPGDILFVDSSHTVKTGGDVTWIFHELIPRLAVGVYVHIHDVFLPGDYPQSWVTEGWGWNETYMVRSFLSYNTTFEVVWGAQFMLEHHPDEVLRAFARQQEYRERGGAALWIRRAR